MIPVADLGFKKYRFRHWVFFSIVVREERKVEVREVFSVNGWNTFQVSLDKPRLSILNGGRFDNTSFCQMNMFKQVEITPAFSCLNK